MLPSPLCLKRWSTFPLDGLVSLNWANFSLKSTHQQRLLCNCYQNNATAKKEALNDVIRETNMASKLNKVQQQNCSVIDTVFHREVLLFGVILFNVMCSKIMEDVL